MRISFSSFLLGSSLAFVSSLAQAGTFEDVQKIRKLLQPGYDVAQIQAAVLTGSEPKDAYELAKNNYVYSDFNKDGVQDVMVLIEKTPVLFDSGKGVPCDKYEFGTCDVVYGDRTLQVYYGASNGTYHLGAENTVAMLKGDDGGVWGDPANGLELTKTGAVTISWYGGSNWRWNYVDTVQFRGDDFYVIGKYSSTGWTGDGREDSEDINLITGDRITTHLENGDAKPVVTKDCIAKAPLVRLNDYQGQQ